MAKIDCPAGICGVQIHKMDPDRMFGHLLTDHQWTFDTANSWMAHNWPDDLPEPKPDP